MESPDTLEVMTRAVRAAGVVARRHYLSGSMEVRRKAAGGDFVSSADLDAERAIISVLASALPSADIVAEESAVERGGMPGSGMTFYVDPVDGTLNFLHGVPFFAVSIGCWIDGQPAAAAVLNPLSEDLYTAARGAGARKNGRPIRVSAADSLRESFLSSGWPYDHARGARLFPAMERLYARSQQLRAMGCASLGFCLVAEGVFDGYWEQALKPWDLAAGALIVREAGGTVSSQTGGPLDLARGDVAASNGRIHAELVAALADGGAS